ncbi:MAG TPA: VTT domain-containing protein [Galbitalea sp.]
MHFAHQATGLGGLLNPTTLIHAVGPYALLVIVLIVFIETGLLFPFLPGDSLVFAAAIVVGTLGIPLWLLILVIAATAFAGSQTSFAIGRRVGPRLFKPDARLFKTRYRDQAEIFFAKYGPGSLVLARFVPIVRTYISPIVGASNMKKRVFALWNAIGAILWALVLCLAGFWLGKIPAVANNIELIAVAIILVSVVPVVIGAITHRRRERRAARVDAAES